MLDPTPAFAVEEYLRDFHDRRPGATSHCLAAAPTLRPDRLFPSPYACLADVVPRADRPLSVLDVACGDGHLLGELAARNQPGLRLTGIDLSAGELAKARQRLGDKAELLQGRAQSLPLPDGCLDVVVSHMALMLMSDVERVVAEIRRVLKPGGRFSAVLGGRGLSGPGFDLWIGLLKAAKADDGAANMQFGDPRTRSVEGLRALFEHGFTDVEIHELEVDCGGDAAQVWDWLSHLYDVDRLSPASRERFRTRFMAGAGAAADGTGVIACKDGLRQILATAA